MKTFSVDVQKRAELGKKNSKKLRKDLHIPCVLYGGKENIHFHTHENTFKDLIYTDNAYIVELNIDGKKHHAVIKDIQFHPVTDRVLHIDFTEVIDGKPVAINIPVELSGNSIGIRNGGKLRFNRRYLLVSGLQEHLPDSLKVDITDVGIGDAVYVKDLEFENLTLLDPESAMIVGVASSRVVAKGMMPAEEEEEAEGEEAAAEGEAAEAPKQEASE
ncbi:MAG: 50S ribosomal protein L25/general stress protein Ctc [Bacteroidota bacterium]